MADNSKQYTLPPGYEDAVPVAKEDAKSEFKLPAGYEDAKPVVSERLSGRDTISAAHDSTWTDLKNALSHPIDYLGDVERDVTEGGGSTVVGRTLGHLQHGSLEDTGYTADHTAVAPIMAGMIQGPPKVARGALRMAEDVKNRTIHPITSYKEAQSGAPDEFVSGLNEAVSGAVQTPGPLIALSPTSIPRAFAATGASKVAQTGLEAIGAPKEYAELGGNIAGGAAAGVPEYAESIGNLAEEITGSRRPVGIATSVFRTPARYPQTTAAAGAALALPVSGWSTIPEIVYGAKELLASPETIGTGEVHIPWAGKVQTPEFIRNAGLSPEELQMEAFDRRVKVAKQRLQKAEKEFKKYEGLDLDENTDEARRKEEAGYLWQNAKDDYDSALRLRSAAVEKRAAGRDYTGFEQRRLVPRPPDRPITPDVVNESRGTNSGPIIPPVSGGASEAAPIAASIPRIKSLGEQLDQEYETRANQPISAPKETADQSTSAIPRAKTLGEIIEAAKAAEDRATQIRAENFARMAAEPAPISEPIAVPKGSAEPWSREVNRENGQAEPPTSPESRERIEALTDKSPAELLSTVEEKLAKLSVKDGDLQRVARSVGIDPNDYDLQSKVRGEGRRRPEVQRLAKDIANKLHDEEIVRHGMNSEKLEKSSLFSQAARNNEYHKAFAKELFKHRLSGAPVDEFGNPTVKGGAPEASDIDRFAEEHTKALYPGKRANVEVQERIPQIENPAEAQQRAAAFNTVHYPRGVPGARILESSGLNVAPLHEINVGGRTRTVQLPGEASDDVITNFIRKQYPNENAVVLPRETAGGPAYSPEELNEAAAQHMREYERQRAQHNYVREPGELINKHTVHITDEHGNDIGQVSAVELTSEPGVWRIQSSESKATPGSHVGRDAYKQILDSAKAEARETGRPITVLGDAVQSPQAEATWRALGKEYGPVSTDYTTGRYSINLTPKKSSGIPRIGELAKQLWEREHGELGKPGSVGDEWHTGKRFLSPEEKAKLNDALSPRRVNTARSYWGDTSSYDRFMPDQSVEVGGGRLSLLDPNEGVEESNLKRQNPFNEFHGADNPLGQNVQLPTIRRIQGITPPPAERLGTMGASYEARPSLGTKFSDDLISKEDPKVFVERMRKGVKPIKETLGEQTGKAGYSGIKEPPLRSKIDAGPALGELGYVRPPDLVEVPRNVRIPREMTEALNLPDQRISGTAVIPRINALREVSSLETIPDRYLPNGTKNLFTEVPDIAFDLGKPSSSASRVPEVKVGEGYKSKKTPKVSTWDIPKPTQQEIAELNRPRPTPVKGPTKIIPEGVSGNPKVRIPEETSFEAQVNRLKLKPDQYLKSPELWEWVKDNRFEKYVPQYLLDAWNLSSIPEEEEPKSILGQKVMW